MTQPVSVHVDLERLVAGTGLAVTRLTFDLTATAAPRTTASGQWIMWGDIHLEAAHSLHYLAALRPTRPFAFPNGSAARPVAYCDLTAQQFDEIENQRDGGDLRLLGDLNIVGLDGTVAITQQAQRRVTAAEWADVLSQARRAESVLLTVPAPRPGLGTAAADAWQRWQRAIRAVEAGRWQEAVAECRMVFDLIDSTEPVAAARHRGKAERWQAVVAATKNVTNAAHHADEMTAAITWTRDDAVAAVAATGALLRVVWSTD